MFSPGSGVVMKNHLKGALDFSYPSNLYVLIHKNRVSIRVNNHEAGRAGRAVVGFGNEFRWR